MAKCQHLEGGFSSLVGLCSFFVLAYTRLVRLTSEIVGRAKVFTFTNSSGPQEDSVFLYNGTVPWFDLYAHVPYAVPILLCSFVCVFIPTLLLVSFPLLPRLLAKLNIHERRPFCWLISLLSVSHLLFLYDIFQGCFKPNARYFAALYLIYRHLFVIAWAYTTTLLSCSLWQIMLSVSFLTIHSLAQPFSSSAVNKITGLVIANLILVIALAQYSTINDELGFDDLAVAVKVFIVVLLYLPHFAVACLFTWAILRCIYQRTRQSCAPRGASHRASSGQDCEESSSWEGTRDKKVGTGYAQLERVEEEEDGEDGDGDNGDRQAEQLVIRVQRHTSDGVKMYKRYGSLTSCRKTQ